MTEEKSKLFLRMKTMVAFLPYFQVVFLSVSPGHVQTDMGNASGRTVRDYKDAANWHSKHDISYKIFITSGFHLQM